MNELKKEINPPPTEEMKEPSVSSIPTLSSQLTPAQKKRLLELHRRAEAAYNKQNYLWASELYCEIHSINRAEHAEYLQRMLLSSIAKKNLSGNPILYSLKQFFICIPDFFKALKLKDTDDKRVQFFDVHEAILKREPDFKFSLVRLAEAYERADLKQNAAILWENYLRTRKNDIPILRRMGDLYLSILHVEKARSAFKRIIALKPFDQAAEKKLKDAMALTSIDETKLKKSSFRDNVKNTEATYRAQIEMKSNKTTEDLDYLIQEKQKEINSNTANVSLRYELLNYYKLKSDREKILHTLDTILSISSADIDLYLEKINAELDWIEDQNKKLSSEERAKKIAQHKKTAYQALIEKFPTSVDLKFKMAKTLFELEENDESLKFFQSTSRVADMATESLFFMGQILSRKGMADLAIEQFQQTLNLIPTMNELKKETLYQLGLAYEKSGKIEQALEKYKTIYTIDVAFKDVSSRIETAYKNKTSAP
jgi:tetratricopeptide (TPR) repeat protein